MRQWSILLAGPILWTAHFFALYIVASVFPGSATAILLVAVLTAGAVVIGLWLLRRTSAGLGQASDPFDRWGLRLSTGATAVSLVAILYQAMPALLG